MSDLYDSLEEGNDENKRSCDSLDQIKAEASKSYKEACQSKSMHQSPFYLNQNLNKENLTGFPYLSSAFSNLSPNYCQEKSFLPKIKNKYNSKDQEPVQKLIVDNQALSKQGLQLNNDGSFTKSPRPEVEELPFVCPEYRDLNYLKHKIKNSNKKIVATRPKEQNKNLFTFTDNPVNGISMNAIISARKKKGSSEEILLSEHSSNTSKTSKHFCKAPNLTDSMKEELLYGTHTPGDNQENPKPFGNPRKREFHVQENNVQSGRTWRLKNENHDCLNFSPKERVRGNSNVDGETEPRRKPKSVERTIPRYRSDFLVSMGKPKLSYSERHQLQHGYNPLHLRLANKKSPVDTNRSNFGDSTTDKLSGISSRVQSPENLLNENEETFYKRLMEEDRNQGKKAARSSRSEGPVEFINLKDIGSSSEKKEKRKNPDQVKLTEKNSLKNKHISKSLSLDVPFKSNPTNTFTAKNNHPCLGGSSLTWSKAELALKAKTYGYMVNARNIFKLKAKKAEAKSCSDKATGRSRKSKSEKIHPQPSQQPFGLEAGKEKIKKRISLTENSLPVMKRQLFGGSQDFSKLRPRPNRVKPLEEMEGNEKNLVLPEVHNLSSRTVKMKADVLEGISSCLKSPKR